MVSAPPPRAQVRCITLIYVENVGSQFLSLRQMTLIIKLNFRKIGTDPRVNPLEGP